MVTWDQIPYSYSPKVFVSRERITNDARTVSILTAPTAIVSLVNLR